MAAKSKYNKALGNFIADKVQEGFALTEIHASYPDEVPTPKTMWTWKKQYPEFREIIEQAYVQQLYNQLDEINVLSKELLILDSEMKDKFDVARASGDPAEVKEALAFAKINSALLRDRRDNIRVRIDTIKFNLSKIAPKLIPELKDNQPKIAVSMPTINVISYKDIED